MRYTVRAFIGLVAVLAMAGCGAGPSSDFIPTGMGTVTVNQAGSTVMGGGTASATAISFVRVQTGAGYLYVSDRPVTRGQWQAMAGTTPWLGLSSDMGGGDAVDLPACNISWTDATDFARRVSIISGKTIELPTAIEMDALTAVSNTALTITMVAETTLADGPKVITGRTPQILDPVVYDVVGNVRVWTTEQLLVGGSWADLQRTTGAGKRFPGVPAMARHPLVGVRLVARTL